MFAARSDSPVDSHHAIEIRSLAPGDDTTAFRPLNEEWIAGHFTLEAKDLDTLNDPVHSILRKDWSYLHGLHRR